MYDLQSWRKPVSTDTLLEKYKGTDKEAKMRIIFGNMDEMDSVNSVVQKDNYVSPTFRSQLSMYFNLKDDSLEQKFINEYSALKSANVTVDDMNEAFQTLVEAINNQKTNKEASTEKVLINNIAYIKETTLDEDYKRESYIDENGVKQFQKNIYNEQNSKIAEIIETFDEDLQVTTQTTKYRNGVTEFINFESYTSQVKLNDNIYNTENDYITNIALNKNNEMLALNIKPVYDENSKISDIEMNNKNNLPIDFSEKEKFIEMLNSGYELFKDFQLKVAFENGNQVVSIIENKKTPTE